MTLAFRTAVEADLDTVAALIDAAYAHYVPILGRARPMDDDHLARLSREETFLLEDDGRPVAVTSMSLEDDAIHIFNIAVEPAEQGKGHLRRILTFAEDKARAIGANRLTLYTHSHMTRNRAVYPHLGFTAVREEETADGHRIVFFERPLAGA